MLETEIQYQITQSTEMANRIEGIEQGCQNIDEQINEMSARMEITQTQADETKNDLSNRIELQKEQNAALEEEN